MLRQVMTSCKHKDCNYHDDDGDGKNSDDDDDGNDDDNEDGDEVEGRARRKAAAGRDQSGLTESCWGQSLLPCLPQRATKNVIISILLIIINTRPKPPYGRQGLAGLRARIQSGGYILGRSQRLTSRLRRSARIG